MKRWIQIFAVLGLLAGCSSTPKEEQAPAKVDDARPPTTTTGPEQKPPTDVTTKPITPQTITADPLKDPANILSRRSVFFDYDSNVVKEEFKPVVSWFQGGKSVELSDTLADDALFEKLGAIPKLEDLARKYLKTSTPAETAAGMEFVLEGLKNRGVGCKPVIDSTRPTTNKNAIVAGGYRLLKVDTLLHAFFLPEHQSSRYT